MEHVEKPIEGISLTERWDERIKETATKVSRGGSAGWTGGLTIFDLSGGVHRQLDSKQGPAS